MITVHACSFMMYIVLHLLDAIWGASLSLLLIFLYFLFFSPDPVVTATPRSPSRRPLSSSLTNPPQASYTPYTPSFMHSQMYLNQPYPAGYLNPSVFSYNMGSPRGQYMRPSFTSNLQQNPSVQPSEEVSAPQNSTTASAESTDTPLEVADLNSSPQKEDRSCDQQPSAAVGFQAGYSPYSAAESPLRSASFLPQHSSPVQSSLPGFFPSFSHGYGLAASRNPTDQSKQISLLLSELDAAKAQNKRVRFCLVL
jgi:hypothetical protein